VRADLVIADRGAEAPGGVERIEEGPEKDVLFDGRQVPYLEGGYGGILARLPQLDSVQPLFHPYRLHVLHHVHRVFSAKASASQFLVRPKGLHDVAEFEIEHLDRWTKTQECAERFEYWNRCCELPLLADTFSHGRVFGVSRTPAEPFRRAHDEQKEDYCTELFRLLRAIPLWELERIRKDLVTTAEMLDGNKILHVLIRLMAVEQREHLRGDIGAAMQLLAMAECLRRAAEAALDQQLPEEDEIGFGQWIDGARKTIYGSERVLDCSPADRRDFMSSMGLDGGPKVRCYVEGDTELAALESAVGEGSGITFVNLHGQFAEARGRGLAFAESLYSDKTARVFSVIALDGDRSENVRVVRKAAEDDRMFGPFFFASPDFEFENFALPELVTVAIELVQQEGGTDLPNEEGLLKRVAGVASGKQFFAALKDTPCAGIEKGSRWGEALMKYALNHEQLPCGHKKSSEVRQVVKIAHMLLRARQSGYMRSVNSLRIDPQTGEIVPRQATTKG